MQSFQNDKGNYVVVSNSIDRSRELQSTNIIPSAFFVLIAHWGMRELDPIIGNGGINSKF
jgi:hypothetical protein